MFTRATILWVIVGAAVGYALAAPAVEAQNAVSVRPPFVAVGDHVMLRFERGTLTGLDRDSTVECVVSALQDMWMRCGPEDKFSVDREQRWFSFQRVVEIRKRER